MSITSTGYSVKRYNDILNEIRQGLITASGNPNLDMSDDSILGLLNNIYSLPLSDLHELAQALWSAGDVDTATGIELERLVARGRVYRQGAVTSSGTLQFTGPANTQIVASTKVKDLEGLIVETINTTTLDTNNLHEIKLSVVVRNSTMYTVSINGIPYNYFSNSVATEPEIINSLANILNATSVVSAQAIDGNTLLIAKRSADFFVTVSQNIIIGQVTKSIRARCTQTGPFLFEKDSLNILIQPITGVTVTNVDDFVAGRNIETDSELRNRFKNTRLGQGKATLPAIYTAVSSVSGVTSLNVEENYTETTNSNGLPAKSFEVLVSGGSDEDIASVIFNTKPAGIRPHGNTTVEVDDSQGKPQLISFSRPSSAYMHVQVTYSTYSEEILPSNADELITAQIVAYGNSVGVGTDIIAERFYGSIYSNVAGIGNMTIRLAKTANPFDTPVYSNLVVIEAKEAPLFEASRIYVSKL